MEPKRLISPYLIATFFLVESSIFFGNFHLEFYASRQMLLFRIVGFWAMKLFLIAFMFRRQKWAAYAYLAMQLYNLFKLCQLSALYASVPMPHSAILLTAIGLGTALIAVAELSSRGSTSRVDSPQA